MNELELEAAELKNLARVRPKANHYRRVEQALASKWEGSQALALKALSAWGDRRSAEMVKAFLEKNFDGARFGNVEKSAIEVLAAILERRDLPWLTEFVQSHDGRWASYALRPLTKRAAELDR